MRSEYKMIIKKIIAEDILLDTYFFSKKKFLEHKKVNCFSLCEEMELFCKSYMVVFVTRPEIRDVLLNELEVFCKRNNSYGPIVKLNESEVLYFPQLRYQDGFFIKNILEDKLNNEKFDVLFGDVII